MTEKALCAKISSLFAFQRKAKYMNIQKKFAMPLVCVSILCTACVESPSPDQQSRAKSANLDQPVHSEYLWNIAKEFENNSIVAEDKYLFKPIELKGLKVTDIDDGVRNESVEIDLSATIPPGGSWQLFAPSSSCEVERSHPAVRALQKGDNVTVRGVFVSESMGLRMNPCKFFIPRTGQWH
ncbi:hypothetical protein [Synechococcus sp. RS9916]|uniref:OB-fold protein n=1 Tax=Synechococcus sp. RS9916 TaxID=221359 RepID=UPI0012E9978D|nr:hypothetical protein [Synechococcus sp. RS9916]